MFFKVKFFAFVNLTLAILNVLPHEKLDGGQLLELILQQKYDWNLSMKIFKICSLIVVLILGICSLVLIFCVHNFTLFLVVCMLFVSK